MDYAKFNNPQNLRLGVFNDKKEEELVSLSSVDDLYAHAERLKATLSGYQSSTSTTQSDPNPMAGA